MSKIIDKNFIHFKTDVLIIEYVFTTLVTGNTIQDTYSSITFRCRKAPTEDNPLVGPLIASLKKTWTSAESNGITIHDFEDVLNPNTPEAVSIIKSNICAKVAIEPEDTESLDVGIYIYQLEVKDLDNRPFIVATGEMDLREVYNAARL